MQKQKEESLILWFDEITIHDVALVGGKNASLGEMYRHLTNKHINIPFGFAITAHAYRYLLEHSRLEEKIRDALGGLDTHNMENLRQRGEKARTIIRESPFPRELTQAIEDAYKKMEARYSDKVDVAVRSSATAEDLPDASFAGQQETFLNIRGKEFLI
ncbi:MAG: PEP/pyruvate-binding domain-containing protein, partial [Thermodesulfobacteriota bacterium]|nr:PEP/pyruvate-binding domain-containing protein [Thermodesulfobacteriota bacterium]